ncbi:concanavalin A-like lectin/glucanase domain-containing protein [Haematococcus lacustris]
MGASSRGLRTFLGVLLLAWGWPGAHATIADRRVGAPVGGKSGVSRPGGAGHALLFRDHVIVKQDFKKFPRTALTFEAWISSSDFCHSGTLLSYAKNSQAEDEDVRVRDFNHFVIFDPRNVLACHDYQYIDMIPDNLNQSCHTAFKANNRDHSDRTAKLVDRNGGWHHLAVTWTAADKGLTNIYMDGLLMASAVTHKTAPLEPGGSFMIGGEQDCYGGCTDLSQSFHGRLDEVRLWSVARSQADILRTMRWVTGLEREPGLVAWWQFNEPDGDDGQFRQHTQALDSSGNGNHLPLLSPPMARDVSIAMPGDRAFTEPALRVGALQFHNNFASNKVVRGMPGSSFTVEMWVKGQTIGQEATTEGRSNLLSYATQRISPTGVASGFMDDALRIERVLDDLTPPWLEPFFATSTTGSVALHINSNEHTDSENTRAWIYFDAQWKDELWHHLAVMWNGADGKASLMFDGVAVKPFWKSDHGLRQGTSVEEGGVNPQLAAGSSRGKEGSLVLGQDQDCYGGCFSPSDAFFGEMALVRIWTRTLTEAEVRRNMGRSELPGQAGLAAQYLFGPQNIKAAADGGRIALDSSGNNNHLALRSNPPLFVYSTAPLAFSDGRPVALPLPGAGGYSLALSDQQVLLRTNFKNFPSTALTLEFWMWSVDTCRPGVPFSYAAGQYEKRDNAFLLFNYNSWGVSVMEDEGTRGDHMSGVSATDGNWHHVAVTWQSSTGEVVLYDNGRPMWTVTRGRGSRIPSGGTLVVGREQDCVGGCFDSATGGAGRTSPLVDQEYGPQDFYGVVEEMRLWRVVRTPEEIRQSMAADDGRGPGGFVSPGIDPKHPDLVAYYNFDEGAGYVVKDISGNGNDLLITQPPTWEVTRWLSTCGNAVVEGLEECDDGDLSNGDGCSAACVVEPGWKCSGSPSICVHSDRAPIYPPNPDQAPTRRPEPSGGDGGRPLGPQPDPPAAVPSTPAAASAPEGQGGQGVPQGGGHSKGWIAAVVIGSVAGAVALSAVGVAAFLFRRKIADTGAQVATSVGSASSRLTDSLLAVVPGADGLLRGRQGYSNTLTYDPTLEYAPAGAPDFMAMSPAPRNRAVAPGTPGAYQSLVGSPLPPQAPRSNSFV